MYQKTIQQITTLAIAASKEIKSDFPVVMLPREMNLPKVLTLIAINSVQCLTRNVSRVLPITLTPIRNPMHNALTRETPCSIKNEEDSSVSSLT